MTIEYQFFDKNQAVATHENAIEGGFFIFFEKFPAKKRQRKEFDYRSSPVLSGEPPPRLGALGGVGGAKPGPAPRGGGPPPKRGPTFPDPPGGVLEGEKFQPFRLFGEFWEFALKKFPLATPQLRLMSAPRASRGGNEVT